MICGNNQELNNVEQYNENCLVEVERENFGCDHTNTGAILAEKWDFSGNLREALAFHHAPENAHRYPELTHIIYLADLISSRFQTGQELDRLNKLGFRVSRFNEIIQSLPWDKLNLITTSL